MPALRYARPVELTVAREAGLARALRLEYLTVGWNVVEGLVAVAAALAAGSVALLGFGIDSFVETASGLVLVWRLRAERRHGRHHAERLDRLALRLVGLSLFALAAWVAFDAGRALLRARGPRGQPGRHRADHALDRGHALAGARQAPRRRGAGEPRAGRRRLPDHGLLLALGHHPRRLGRERAAGLVVGRPAAALGLTPLLVREGREAWRGESCSCNGTC